MRGGPSCTNTRVFHFIGRVPRMRSIKGLLQNGSMDVWQWIVTAHSAEPQRDRADKLLVTLEYARERNKEKYCSVLLDVGSGKLVYRFDVNGMSATKFAGFDEQDRSLITVCESDPFDTQKTRETIYMWDLSTGKRKHAFPRLKGQISDFSVNTRRPAVVTVSGHDGAVIWDTSSAALSWVIPPLDNNSRKNWIQHARFSPGGKYLVVEDYFGTEICVWNYAKQLSTNPFVDE